MTPSGLLDPVRDWPHQKDQACDQRAALSAPPPTSKEGWGLDAEFNSLANDLINGAYLMKAQVKATATRLRQPPGWWTHGRAGRLAQGDPLRGGHGNLQPTCLMTLHLAVHVRYNKMVIVSVALS